MNRFYKNWAFPYKDPDDIVLSAGCRWMVLYIPKDGRDFNRHELKPGNRFWSLCKDTVLYDLKKKVKSVLGYDDGGLWMFEDRHYSVWEINVQVKLGTKKYEALKKVGFKERDYCV